MHFNSLAHNHQSCSNIFSLTHSPQDLAMTSLFQMVADDYGWDILRLSDLFLAPDSSLRKNVFNALSKLSFENGASESQLEETIQTVYNLIFPIPDSKEKKTPSDLINEYKRQNEILYLIQIHTLAFQQLGLLKDQKPTDHLKKFRNNHPIAETLVVTSIMNTITITYFSFLSHFPNFLLSKTRKIPDNLINRIKLNNDAEASKEELRQLGWDKATIDHNWKMAGKTYFYLTRALTVFMFLQALPVLKYSFLDYYLNESNSTNTDIEIFNADQFRFEQLESWRKAFFLLEGRFPDPDHLKEDREEMDRVQENIENIIKDRLKTKKPTSKN